MGYQGNDHPNTMKHKPTTVELQFYFESLGVIDQVDMTYTCNVYIRQHWNDP